MGVTNMTKALLGGVAVAVLAGGGGYLLARRAGPAQHAPKPAATRPVTPVAAHPATEKAEPAPAATAPEPAPTKTASDAPMVGPCPAPAQAPPQTPDGATATDAQMKAAHDALQAYVDKLEAFQACLNHAADTAGNDVPPEMRNNWIDRGNGAVDEATLLAQAYADARAAHLAAQGKK